jgi:hypothetical protein
MLELEVFVGELGSVNGFAAYSRTVRKVTTYMDNLVRIQILLLPSRDNRFNVTYLAT